jgi:antitoxin CptB
MVGKAPRRVSKARAFRQADGSTPRRVSEAPTCCDLERRRLAWRCRRGMKELDVLLERYRLRHLGAASPQERKALERLLRLPDPLLADLLLHDAAAADPQLLRLIQLIVGA